MAVSTFVGVLKQRSPPQYLGTELRHVTLSVCFGKRGGVPESPIRVPLWNQAQQPYLVWSSGLIP